MEGAETIEYTTGTKLAARKTPINCKATEKWLGLSDRGDSFSSDVNSGGENEVANIKLANDIICQDSARELLEQFWPNIAQTLAVGKTTASFVVYRNALLFKPGAEADKKREKRAVDDGSSKKKAKSCGLKLLPTNNLIVSAVTDTEPVADSTAVQSAAVKGQTVKPKVPIDVRLTFTKENVSSQGCKA